MLVVPVLDLMGGLVVRGIAGRREEYQPIRSRLTDSAEPLAVARAFRTHFGLTTLYVADLDAIAGGRPAWAILDALRADGFALWLDAGVRAVATVAQLQRPGIHAIVAGLETIPGPDLLKEIRGVIEPERILVSIDLKHGQPLTPFARWQSTAVETIAREIVNLGYHQLLLLDLAQVGMGQGTGTEALCRRLREQSGTDVSLYVGGGVRGPDDLQRLKVDGIAGVLVASALHDGRLARADIQAIE